MNIIHFRYIKYVCYVFIYIINKYLYAYKINFIDTATMQTQA